MTHILGKCQLSSWASSIDLLAASIFLVQNDLQKQLHDFPTTVASSAELALLSYIIQVQLSPQNIALHLLYSIPSVPD